MVTDLLVYLFCYFKNGLQNETKLYFSLIMLQSEGEMGLYRNQTNL